MRRVIACAVVASLALAVGHADAAFNFNRVVVRAVAAPTAKLAAQIAKGAAYTRLDRARYPDLGAFTAAQAITVLCGEVRPAYWVAFLELNGQPSLTRNDPLKDHDPYNLKWPACVYSAPNAAYVVKANDNPAKVYKKLTGKTGTKKAVEDFFGGKSLGVLQPGQIISAGHVTLATPLTVIKPELQATLDEMAKVEAKRSHPELRQLTNATPGARILVAAGYVSGMTAIPAPAECDGAIVQPETTRARIEQAYRRALHQMNVAGVNRASVEVMVIDNGFLGVEETVDGPKIRAKFPELFFSKNYGSGFIGPTLQIGGPVHPWIAPPAKPNDVAGHGTHVTGLVLGGPAFVTNLQALVADGQGTMLKVAETNVGNGAETLLPGSSNELRTVTSLAGFRIVNMSLEYQDTAAEAVKGDFGVMFGDPSPLKKLFVVAAGNDGVALSGRYPASFGGLSKENVITVGATRPDGTLTSFSNWGPFVDIAAPGCGLMSSIDENYRLAPMSGTSQAAPQVSFAAALLHTLGNLSALEIKTRLVISGDLLVAPSPPEKDRKRDPGAIASRSSLNVERALYLYDDYLQLNDGRTFLGELKEIRGLACRDAGLRTPVEQQDTLAFKRDSATGGWVFASRADGGLRNVCAWDRAEAGKLTFAPALRIGHSGPGKLEAGDPNLITDLRLSGVQYLVLRRSLKVTGG